MDSNTVTKKNKYNLFPERTLDMNQLIKLPLPNTTDKLTIHITPIKADKGTPEVPVVNIGLEHEDGTETDILALDQFDVNTSNMLADRLSLYVWGNPEHEDYTDKHQFPLAHNNRDEQ